MVTWDSDTSSSDDDDSDDDKTTKKKSLASIAINEKSSLFDTPSTCFMAKATKVNYKARGRHWVLDSGCTQHMTGDSRMFNSINTNYSNGVDSITFGDNDKVKVKGFGKIAISNDLSIFNVLLVESLNFNLLSIAQLCDLGFC